MEHENIAELVGNMTTNLLKKAKDGIDTTFGKGYAKEHPELVSKFMEVSSGILSDMMLQIPDDDPYDMDDFDDEEDDDDIEDLFQN